MPQGELFLEGESNGDFVGAGGAGGETPAFSDRAEGGFVEEGPGRGAGGDGGENASVRADVEADGDGAFLALADGGGRIGGRGLSAFAFAKDEGLDGDAGGGSRG